MANNATISNGKNLFEEIKTALEDLGGWGSVEIYVQNGKVTQITRRAIRKVDQDITQMAEGNWGIDIV